MNDLQAADGDDDGKLRELAVWRRLMEVCQQYEAAYQRGERPALSQLAHEFSESDRAMVLDELERVQFELADEAAAAKPLIDGRFVVLEPLARGGMGEVSVARDEEFQRDVAFKEIRDGAADDHRYRSRFLREAEITAQLEHPGIIPVYARGEREDGRPFYVMRLIRGDQTGTLHEGIRRLHDPAQTPPAEFAVNLRRLVRRLIDVCNTMAYAHSRGVIHRDLKPANILLGAYGETLVVDWGLARMLDAETWEAGAAVHGRDTVPTEPGESPGTSGIGTPGYASPEQLGLHNTVASPAADIYSLGTILYSLLTGRPPISASDSSTPQQLFERVNAGAFRPPRVLNPLAPPALEAICLRAMQTDPQLRYPTTTAFAAELERWFADEPVEAWGEPYSAKVRRWLLRNRTAAAVGFGALLISIPGLALIIMLQAGHARDLGVRESRLTAALSELRREQQQTQAEHARAEEQWKRAESREQLAISAIDRFRAAITDEPLLQNSGQLAELRTRLLTQPIRFYGELLQQLQEAEKASPAAAVRFARASLALARQHVAVGEWPRAVELLTAAEPLLEDMLQVAEADSPLHRDLSCLLALTLLEQGQISDQRRNAPGDAESSLRKSLKILEGLSQKLPATELATVQALASEVRSSLAAVLGRNDRPAESVPLLQEAIRLREQFVPEPEQQTASQLKLADLHVNLGVSLAGLQQFKEAEKEYAAATAVYEAIEKHSGPTAALNYRRAGVLFNQGRLLELQNALTQALNDHKAALQLRRSLHLDSPSVHEYRIALLASRDRVVDLQLKTGAAAEAIQTARDWVEDSRKICELSPGHLEYRIELLDSLHTLGHLHAVIGRPLEAEPSYREALAINTEVRQRESANPVRERNHAELLEHVAQLDFHHGNFMAARTALEEAIPLQRNWIKTNPARPLDGLFLKQMLDTLARCCDRLNDPEAAAAARKQAGEQ